MSRMRTLLVLLLTLALASVAGTTHAGSIYTRGEVLVAGNLVELGTANAVYKTDSASDFPLGVVAAINIRGVTTSVIIVNTDDVYVDADEAITAGEFISPSGGTGGTVVGEATIQDNSFGIAVADSIGGQVKMRFVDLNPDSDDAPSDSYFVTTLLDGDLSNDREHPNSGNPNYNVTHQASDISDFDTEVSNNTDVAANTSARHVSGSDNQSLFATIDASSGTDPVADSATDTLIVAGASGIVVTGDQAADSITISPTYGTSANQIAQGNDGRFHTQGTDLGLDTGGTNPVTAAEAEAAYDHSIGDGTDHGLSAADVNAIGDAADTVKDTHPDWGTGAGQISADDIPDGATNAIPTLTQESNWDTAYGASHTQGTDQGLDTGGANAVTAAEAKSAYTHSGLTSGNPHSVSKSDIGLGSVGNILCNFVAVIPPTVDDDVDLGYSAGSVWVDTATDLTYVCSDATDGAAVWTNISAGAVGGIGNVVEDVTPQLGGDLDVNSNDIILGQMQLRGNSTDKAVRIDANANEITDIYMVNDGTYYAMLFTAGSADPTSNDARGMRYTNGSIEVNDAGTWEGVGTGAGTDTNAIHVNAASEITAITEKTAPVGNDEMVIEDSEDSSAKKSLKLSNLSDILCEDLDITETDGSPDVPAAVGLVFPPGTVRDNGDNTADIDPNSILGLFEFTDEFMTTTAETMWTITSAGSGAANSHQAIVGNAFGVQRLTAGTAYLSNAKMIMGSDTIEPFINTRKSFTEMSTIITALPNDVLVSVGFTENPATGSFAAGDSAAFWCQNSVNSGNWQAVSYNDASGQTTNLATSPITVSSVQVLRIELDAAEVRFYINGVLVATHATQVPDEGMGLEFIAFQLANPGTASNLNIDAVRVGQAR